jgi:hypothetical protein
LGSVIETLTVCEVIRPLAHAENGLNCDAGTVVPFSETASVFVSKVQAASSRRLTVLLVTTAFAAGVGAMKRSGPGLGIARTLRGDTRRRPTATAIGFSW